MNSRKLVIGFNNQIAHEDIVKSVTKPTLHVHNAGAKMSQIRSLLKIIKFEIELKLMWSDQSLNGPFQAMSLQHMLKECDEEAWKLRKNIEEKELQANLKFFRQYTVKINDRVANGCIKESIRKVDASKTEYKYVKEKIGCNTD